MFSRFSKSSKICLTNISKIFLLQPLVENAIIHGLEPKAESGYINIVAYMEDDFVEILIRDNGVGIPQDKLCQIMQSLEKEQIESISMQGILP